MGLLSNMKRYSAKWSEVSRNPMTEESDYAQFTSPAEVVSGDYTMSLRITTVDGDDVYMGISPESLGVVVNQKVDLSKCFVIHLKRGDQICDKVLI